MTDRISIPALRKRAVLAAGELAALVEAVEAAQERLETIYESRDPERMTQEAYFGLQHLRARFDFGGRGESPLPPPCEGLPMKGWRSWLT